MKNRSLLAGIIALMVLVSCSNTTKSSEGKFKLTGQIENAADVKKVLLYDGETLVDSAMLDATAKFSFERTVSEPSLYTLVIGFRPYMFILGQNDVVTFKTDLKDGENYEVTGSPLTAELQKLAAIRAKLQKEQSQLESEFESRAEKGEDPGAVQNELMQKSMTSVEAAAAGTYAFANENRDNLAGFYGMLFLSSLDAASYESELIKYAEEEAVNYPNNVTAQSFVKHFAELKALSVGQPAPDFSSTTPDGKTVKLSDFKGKYVLLDFWAAWCGPCRQENPNIVEQYHAFKDKGFTVFGVSLDEKKEAWVKAIYQDKLDWTQVSDLKEWNSEAGQLYNITAIPASFMIGPDGKLVAKNLRGAALKRFLEQTLD